jgi:putative hemolysin
MQASLSHGGRRPGYARKDARGFFAAAEIALVTARVSRLRALRAPAASVAAALRLKESPDTFLATVQIGITLVGTLASAVGGATAVASA